MINTNKILTVIIIAVISIAAIFAAVFGLHYVLGNPLKLVLPTDMRAFTVVNGGDYTSREFASFIRGMKRQDMEYMQISDNCYCAKGENSRDNIDALMKKNGYQYIGCNGSNKNLRCYYKDGTARWVRVEFDVHSVWSVWNFSDAEKYDLKKQGYKTLK